MRRFVKFSFLILLSSFLISLSSCGDDKDDSPYPSIITEMADCVTNSQGTMTKIVLDDDTELVLTNPQTGLKASVTYRALAGYTMDGGKATLYSLSSVPLLRDSTSVAISDPLAVVSLWRTNRYINLHLRPKTQGGKHTWGFIVESIVERHATLRLHHRQGSDPTAYSTDIYVSLPLDLVEADDFTLHIQTFDGMKEWVL